MLKGTCEATVRAISFIVRLSNALQRFLAVVRTSIYNNTADILRIVLLSEGVCSKLSMHEGMALIDFQHVPRILPLNITMY